MSDNGDARRSYMSGRNRALTSLTAMGRHERDRGSARAGNSAAGRDMSHDEAIGPKPRAKVVLGSQALDRSDITEGKPGIPLTLTMTVLDAADGDAPIAGANVEIWHCDADGIYSEYASGTGPGRTATTYLR